MKLAKTAVEKSNAAFFSSLDKHFRGIASKARLQTRDSRLSAVWEQGLFVAGIGAIGKPDKSGRQDVALLQISTPKNRPLLTQENKELPPGDYTVSIGEDGSVALRGAGGRLSIPAAPAGAIARDSGGTYTCRSGLRLEIQYRNCQICITLVCPGQWVVLLTCLTIPFCNVVTGLFRTG